MVWYLNGGLKKACLLSKMSGIQMVKSWGTHIVRYADESGIQVFGIQMVTVLFSLLQHTTIVYWFFSSHPAQGRSESVWPLRRIFCTSPRTLRPRSSKMSATFGRTTPGNYAATLFYICHGTDGTEQDLWRA